MNHIKLRTWILITITYCSASCKPQESVDSGDGNSATKAVVSMGTNNNLPTLIYSESKDSNCEKDSKVQNSEAGSSCFYTVTLAEFPIIFTDYQKMKAFKEATNVTTHRISNALLTKALITDWKTDATSLHPIDAIINAYNDTEGVNPATVVRTMACEEESGQRKGVSWLEAGQITNLVKILKKLDKESVGDPCAINHPLATAQTLPPVNLPQFTAGNMEIFKKFRGTTIPLKNEEVEYFRKQDKTRVLRTAGGLTCAAVTTLSTGETQAECALSSNSTNHTMIYYDLDVPQFALPKKDASPDGTGTGKKKTVGDLECTTWDKILPGEAGEVETKTECVLTPGSFKSSTEANP